MTGPGLSATQWLAAKPLEPGHLTAGRIIILRGYLTWKCDVRIVAAREHEQVTLALSATGLEMLRLKKAGQ
jgi:hypothetical protein